MRAVLNDRGGRRAMRRLVAACLAVAMFAASGGASLLGQVCTHHGGSVEDAHAEQIATTAPEGAHAGHHAPAPDVDEGQPDESHDDGDCSCLGVCQAPPVVAGTVGRDAVRVPAPEYVLLVVATPWFDLVPRASQATWFLPPGNGPPALT